MPDEQNQTMEWIKIGASIIGGGFAGAILTNIINARKNRVQPVTKSMTVSYVNLPRTMDQFSATISLSVVDLTGEQIHSFKQLAIVQFEFINTGNKDYDVFEFGIDVPNNCSIISVQTTGQDRYHEFNSAQEISLLTPTKKLDLH